MGHQIRSKNDAFFHHFSDSIFDRFWFVSGSSWVPFGGSFWSFWVSKLDQIRPKTPVDSSSSSKTSILLPSYVSQYEICVCAPKTAPQTTQNRPKTAPRRSQCAFFSLLKIGFDFDSLRVPFWLHFGCLWGAFLAPLGSPFGIKNRSQN